MSTETRDEQTADPDKETPVTDKPQGENQDETPEPEAEKGKQTEPEQTDETPEPAEDGKAGREAAKYRRQARQAEAERDALAEQLTAARDEIVRQRLAQPVQIEILNPDGTRKTNFGAEGHQRNVMLNHPDDLFRFTDLTPSDLFTEDGRLDNERLTAAVAELHKARPELCGTPKLIVPTAGKVPENMTLKPAFEAAFAPPQH